MTQPEDKKTFTGPLFKLYVLALIVLAIGFGIHKYKQAHPAVSTTTPQSVLDTNILKQEQILAQKPDDTKTALQLASNYLQKARDTADLSYYLKIDALVSHVEQLQPNNPDAYSIEGIVDLGRHHFMEALHLADKIIAINPDKALYYGIRADAQTELGMNDEAIKTLQAMVNLRPDYSSFSRIAYARELHGDIDGAKAAIASAVEAGGAFPENVAWGHVELGKLYFRNDTNAAAEQYQQALGIVPNYPPALEQMGRVAFAQNNTAQAEVYFKQALDTLPLAQYAIDLGEVHAAGGKTDEVQQYYAIAKLAFEKSRQNKVDVGMEFSLFLSEHDLDTTMALQLAQDSYKVRPSIYGADALAWAYYKTGDAVQAQKYIQEALRLGEYDPGIVFHAAMIAKQNSKNGDNGAEAKRLFQKVVALSPHFSILYAGMAEQELAH